MKKFALFICVGIFCLMSMFAFVGCDNNNGQQEQQGQQDPTPAPQTTYYTLDVSVNNNTYGSVVGEDVHGEACDVTEAQYKNGAVIMLTAVANDGYYFVKWSDSSTDETFDFRQVSVNQNITLQAIFAEGSKVVYSTYENDYKIVVKNGKVEDKGSYYYITPNNPGLFGYWKEEHTVSEYSCDRSITISKAGIDRNLTLTAKDTACGWFFGLGTEATTFVHNDINGIGYIYVWPQMRWISYAFFYDNGTQHIITDTENAEINSYGGRSEYGTGGLGYGSNDISLHYTGSLPSDVIRYDARIFKGDDGSYMLRKECVYENYLTIQVGVTYYHNYQFAFNISQN